ncbi:LpqB family beta-propeller domain-containing protein [Prauserella muralis]|uniref:Uncharacterized protein n=1 Tax=Prauserella muralis TaxID=588067 RepID=A0A2V4AZT8_9PSEU|nr:LpqB family beta-propeller domain-containing protein [Prauserella muralis]PXY21440.1 hypothetical protein BAY60_26780 [Prauserella muralis]
MRRRRLRALLAGLTAVLTVSGCAAIPSESQPQAIPRENLGQPTQEIPEPARGLDPLSVVREFVRASAQPTSDYAASRAYLAANAREEWQPDQGLTIIEDEFSTVYAPDDDESTDSDEQLVTVRGTNVGRLGADSAFIPSDEPVGVPVRLRMQPDGQWRIVDAPGTILITESDFTDSYFRVPVYFFAPDSTAIVPDLRYVVARPQSGLPARVMDLLLSGPSNGLAGAVRNPLADATLDSNVTGANDGALLVPLTGVDGESLQEKQLMVAQVVRSLQTVTTSRIRLLSDGTSLVPGQHDWLPSEVPAYEALSSPKSELPGLMTVDSRIRSLGSGAPIAGPAGAGAYEVESAAQSITGGQLAVVESAGPRRVALRVGDYGRDNPVVDLPAQTLTRPSWRPPTSAGSQSNELWTVADGERVVRVSRAPDGRWTPQAVNATDLLAVGRISGLRLSRDGSRVAVIAGGQLVVASVVRSADSASVTLRSPRILQPGTLADVVDVDWLSQDTLIVATNSDSMPVARVSVDGLRLDGYSSANLTPPMQAITAAPGRPIVAADSTGLWTANDVGDVWRPHSHTLAGAEPFYPG